MLTFEEWWDVWQESGHWPDRGRGRGKYVMCRRGDTGPYALGNVYIDLYERNSSDGASKFAFNKELVLAASIKRSKSLKGRTLSEEHKEKIRIAAIGRRLSEETKRKISETKRRGLKEFV